MAAEALKLSLHVVEVHRAEALDDAFAAMTRAGVDALVVFAEPQVITPQRGRIAALAATSRLPAMYDNKTYVEAGGLMSYGAHLPDIYRVRSPRWTKYCTGPSRRTCPLSNRRSSSWSLT